MTAGGGRMPRMPRPISSKLILPGDVQRAGGRLTIHVPKGYEDRGRLIGHCHVCGMEFPYKGDEVAWQRHVGECARQHLGELQANSPREKQRGTIWDDETWDPEVDAHMKELGKKMLKEGRLTVKPHERAGFS